MTTRQLLPPIPTGRNPGPCALDPSGDLLLVANEDSGDLSVIRVRTQSLITMIPVGARPSSIAIKLF
jgi:YVTN family beta-propeller protein